MELPKNSFKISFALLVLALAFNICFMSIDDCQYRVDWRLFAFAIFLSLCALVLWAISGGQAIAEKKRSWWLASLGLCLAVVISGLLLLMLAPVWGCDQSRVDVCLMPNGIVCPKVVLSSETDKLAITIANNLQRAIVVTNLSCTNKKDQYESISGVVVESGKAQLFLTTCNDEWGNPLKFEPDDRYSGKINFEYYFPDEGPGEKKKLSGNVAVRVR